MIKRYVPGVSSVLSSAVVALAFLVLPAIASADTVGPITFEPTTYTVGTINGQDGWVKTGTYDANVTATGIPASFGTQSLQISDAVTSGAFGDQTFAKPLTDSVGETAATAGSYSVGTKQTHFEMQFDIASVLSTLQTGMHLSVSPDRGDGSRMSYLRFEDQADGIHVFFDDVTDPGPVGTTATFNESDIATISRSAHTIKLTMDVVDGPGNDVVKVYIDGTLKATGTSWEDYYRYDPEASAEQSPRIVKTVEFRESGTANADDAGKGFLIDNFSMLAGPAQCNTNATQAIVSDTSTQVDGHNAVAVTPNPAWTASIPGATWIYSQALDANGSSPTGDKTFTKTFNIVGTPADASLAIAADNMYTVTVNGHIISTGTSATDLNNFSSAATWTIPAADLVSGANTLSITVTNPANDPSSGAPFADPNPGGLLYKLTVNNNECVVPPPVQPSVHIFKFLDGVQATDASANNVSFPMFTSTFNAPFTLGPGGWTTGDIDYEASTGPMPSGSSYTANETTSGPIVGAACGTDPYALVGYSSGATLAAAAAATPTATAPSFSNLTSDQYVVVWNQTCTAPPTLKVHILKYLDGAQATAASANNYLFPMTATWNATNIGAGTGAYTLGSNWGGAAALYGADTASMSAPADYITSEITDNTSQVVSDPAQCAPGKYVLNGYRTSSSSFADAATQSLELVPHQFSAITTDQYVIVDNSSCPSTGSVTIEKDTIGGNGTFNFTSDIPGHTSFSITTAGGVGSQTFAGLAPGTYHVTEVAQSGWTLTDNSECSSAAVTAGSTLVCHVINTKNTKLGAIIGTKYADRDGDGTLKDGDHHRLAGVTIYLDTNNNGSLDSGEPSTVTDSHGGYRFLGLTAGTYHVREVVQTGWVQTVPSTGVYNVVLAAGQIAKKKDFGNFKPGSISGMKYNDANGNGKKDANEVGLPGWTIKLKGPGANGSTVSTITDANGNYSFTGLLAGTYTLSEVAQAGWNQTQHPGTVKIQSGTTATKDNFGNTQRVKDSDGDYDGSPAKPHGH